jgi:hypothetical protein
MDNDTGVTVNGQVAMVFNDRFVANHVPLQDGENTITVIEKGSEKGSSPFLKRGQVHS